jgi:uncharacterized protein
LLGCADLEVNGGIEVALVGELRDSAFDSLRKIVSDVYIPSLVLAGGGPTADSSVKLLNDRPLIDGRPTAYVCRGYSCDKPVTDPNALGEQLQNAATVAATEVSA